MDFPFPVQSSTPPTSVWDKVVPLVSNRFHTDAYILDGIEEPSLYAELCHKLYAAEKGDTFTIHLNTPGGMIDSALLIIDAVKASKAKVTARLSGTVASAGTILALACNNIEVTDHLSFMIHNYSGSASGWFSHL